MARKMLMVGGVVVIALIAIWLYSLITYTLVLPMSRP
jgi:hypothetical protein